VVDLSSVDVVTKNKSLSAYHQGHAAMTPIRVIMVY